MQVFRKAQAIFLKFGQAQFRFPGVKNHLMKETKHFRHISEVSPSVVAVSTTTFVVAIVSFCTIPGFMETQSVSQTQLLPIHCDPPWTSVLKDEAIRSSVSVSAPKLPQVKCQMLTPPTPPPPQTPPPPTHPLHTSGAFGLTQTRWLIGTMQSCLPEPTGNGGQHWLHRRFESFTASVWNSRVVITLCVCVGGGIPVWPCCCSRVEGGGGVSQKQDEKPPSSRKLVKKKSEGKRGCGGATGGKVKDTCAVAWVCAIVRHLLFI